LFSIAHIFLKINAKNTCTYGFIHRTTTMIYSLERYYRVVRKFYINNIVLKKKFISKIIKKYKDFYLKDFLVENYKKNKIDQ